MLDGIVMPDCKQIRNVNHDFNFSVKKQYLNIIFVNIFLVFDVQNNLVHATIPYARFKILAPLQ